MLHSLANNNNSSSNNKTKTIIKNCKQNSRVSKEKKAEKQSLLLPKKLGRK